MQVVTGNGLFVDLDLPWNSGPVIFALICG
jgi:hypothetical protein